jgi:cobalamin biosynthesis protein CbiD
VLTKNPEKTRRGITSGTTSAAAASGVGAATPMSDPERKLYVQRISSILLNLPAEIAVTVVKIRIPCRIKYV